MAKTPKTPNLREQWLQVRPRLVELAETLELFAIVSERIVFRLDLKKAQQARDLAFQVTRLARRTLTLPLLTETEVDEGFRTLFTQYFQLQQKADRLMGDWKPKASR